MTLDTLRTARDLEAASFTPAQAEALTKILREREEDAFGQLATKPDLRLSVAELKTDLAELKADLLRWTIGLLLAQTAVIAALVRLL